MIETCCVVDQFCNSPANLSPPIRVRTMCFACGLAVCRNCSIVASYYRYGKNRLCHNCLSDYDENDDRVMQHIYEQAGVKWPERQ